MSNTSRDRGDWMTLIGGVRVSRRWMTRHTPHLLTAWCDADSGAQRRVIAAHILQIAAELESEPEDGATDAVVAGLAGRIAERIDNRLVHAPDWPALAAALTRAHAAGYDVAARLPALAAAAPLPDRHPARELHWRLLDDCPAALPVVHNAGDGAVDNQSTPPQLLVERPPPGGHGAPFTHSSPRPDGDHA